MRAYHIESDSPVLRPDAHRQPCQGDCATRGVTPIEPMPIRMTGGSVVWRGSCLALSRPLLDMDVTRSVPTAIPVVEGVALLVLPVGASLAALRITVPESPPRLWIALEGGKA